MLLIWSTIVAMTMPWIMMGCGKSDDDAGAGAATAQDNDLTDYGPCHDIVELAKQKDWSTGNKCNNCVISSTSNPLDVVQLVSTWQTDSKNGVFSYIDDHFQSAFKRGETDFMSYCVAVMQRSQAKIEKKDDYSSMLQASTSCGGDLAEWIANSTVACDELYAAFSSDDKTAAEGLLSAFSPFFHLGMKNYNPDKDHDFTRGGQASEANSTEAPTPAPTTVATTVATTIKTVAVVEPVS